MPYSRPAIYVDLKRCIGCDACSLACKQENNLPVGQMWNEVYGAERGSYPTPDVRVLPMYCQQCSDAPCKGKCDSLGYRAIKRRPDGILWVDESLCTGCRMCLPECPYKAMYFNETTMKAQKCHMCKHRIDAGLLPACVITCLGITREFGERDALIILHPDAKPMGGIARNLYGHMGDAPEEDGRTAGYPAAAPFHSD